MKKSEDAAVDDENEKKAARLEAEAQAEADVVVVAEGVAVVNQDAVRQVARRGRVTGRPTRCRPPVAERLSS